MFKLGTELLEGPRKPEEAYLHRLCDEIFNLLELVKLVSRSDVFVAADDHAG